MNIRICCVGKLKERCYIEACGEFQKRLSRYCNLSVAEVADEKAPEKLSIAEQEQVKAKEGRRLLANVGERDYLIALTIDGDKPDSEQLARRIRAYRDSGKELAFAIGGSLGLSNEVLERADERLSLSALTLPHRFARLLLLEQLYRSFKIIGNEPYHK
ncbi:MAG: 23S rRNA (pseudouridine(1915)-N(3))-methyltransferase RlmH [Clostridia bacterium]|nr:23S rRNA (pseudouridine(1915)-N(3))-methyltransferase RlmH [Clostridia bacterium]